VNLDFTVRTRRRGGTDRCPACIRSRSDQLGAWSFDLDGNPGQVLDDHTCLDHETPGQAATRQRARRLAQFDRQRTR
jgi:hypothetical protein